MNTSTIEELQHQIMNLELKLDIYIPLYYSLVVTLLFVGLFCMCLVCPARRRHKFRQAVGVKQDKRDYFQPDERAKNDGVMLRVLPDYGEVSVFFCLELFGTSVELHFRYQQPIMERTTTIVDPFPK